jgi:hypothetical protein
MNAAKGPARWHVPRSSLRIMKWWRAVAFGVLGLVGASLGACDQTPPIDENFDSSVGADFRAPADGTVEVDAGATATAASTIGEAATTP